MYDNVDDDDDDDDDDDSDDDDEDGEDEDDGGDDKMVMIIGRIIIIWKLKCKMIIERRMNLMILRRIIEHSIDNYDDDNIYYLCYFEIYWKIILDWVNFEFVYWVGNLL